MIGGVTRFGGRARDARALVAHLGKPQDGGSVYIAGPTTASPDMAGLVTEARFLAAARGVQDRPFLHIHLSPSSTLDHTALVRAAEIVLREIGVTDQPWGMEIHGKVRRSGAGELHAHVVVGRAAASGSLLRSGFEKIRVETAVRVAEYEVGDTHVRGRHYATSLRYLEKIERQDVAQSMRAALDDRKAPRSSLTPERRQSLERRGIDAVEIRAAVRSAWERSDGISSLEGALREHGLAIRRGDKAGVYVVISTYGIEIGALDRLAGARRREVALRLRGWKPEAVRNDGENPLADEPDWAPQPKASGEPIGDLGASDGNRRFSEGAGRRPEPKAGPDGGRAGALDAGREKRRATIAALTTSRAVHVGRDRLATLREQALAILRHDLARRPPRLAEPLVPEVDSMPASSLETTYEHRKEQQPVSTNQASEQRSSVDEPVLWRPPQPF